MRFGVVIPQAMRWSAWIAQVRWAEEIGYDVAYDYDHLTHFTVPGKWLADGFGFLAAGAAATERIELGTLVASATLHSPVALARLATTVDEISHGRFVLGLGAGSPRCAAADRAEDPTPREMSDRFADVVEGYQAVLAGETEWQGATRAFKGLETTVLPEGSPKPFLMLAAHGPRAISIAVRHGDGWNTYGGPTTTQLEPEDYWEAVTAQVARIDAECVAQGRDPRNLRRSLLLGFGKVRPTESVASFVEAAGRAADLGFDEVAVYAPTGEPGDQFFSEPDTHRRALDRLRGVS
jgi:alkanesulfonate monooxygenase SsuD/methylene tetrahydromethanopterin reductase-like flavin-dependent oxidoreductase (luciferase family)